MDSLLQLINSMMQEPFLLLLREVEPNLSQKYCTCLLTIFRLMSARSYELLFRKRRVDLLTLCNLFRTFRGIYERDWFMMQLTSHAILEITIGEIYKDVESQQSARQLSSSYIKLVVEFITHPTLQLEEFSGWIRRIILNDFGDLRIKYSAQLTKFWSSLSKANIYDLTPTSLQAFFSACLVPNTILQSLW